MFGSVRTVCSVVALLALSSLAFADSVGVVVLPVDFEVGQITAGGVFESLADESDLACTQVGSALGNWLSKHPHMRPVAYPAIDEAESATIREHVALFDIAVRQAWVMEDARGSRPFTYSLGDGLAFLRERTGADKAILLSGASLGSTGGRQALKFLEFVMFGVVSPMSYSMAYAGIVDLETGQIEWANVDTVGSTDVTTFEGACKAVDRLLDPYPGGELSIRRDR